MVSKKRAVKKRAVKKRSAKLINISARRCKMLGIDVERTGPSVEDFLQMTHQLVAIIKQPVHDQRILDAIAEQFEATLEQHHAPGLTLVPPRPLDNG